MWLQDYLTVQDKQTQYPLTLKWEWRTLQECSKFQSECRDTWTRLPRHEWPKPWSDIEDPVFRLERNLYGHPTCGPLVGKTVWESSLGTRIGKSTKLWMSICSSKTRRLFLSVYVDDIKLAWRKPNMNQHHFWTVYLGCTHTWMQTERIFFGRVHKDVRITNFCWSNWKIAWMWETSHKNCRVVLRYGRTCEQVRWKIFVSWWTKRQNSCTKSHLFVWRTVISRRRTWKRWEN